MELPEAVFAQSFLYSRSSQNHYQSVFHASADKAPSFLCFFSTALFPLNLFFCYLIDMNAGGFFLNILFALNSLFDNCADVHNGWVSKYTLAVCVFMWSVTGAQNLIDPCRSCIFFFRYFFFAISSCLLMSMVLNLNLQKVTCLVKTLLPFGKSQPYSLNVVFLLPRSLWYNHFWSVLHDSCSY